MRRAVLVAACLIGCGPDGPNQQPSLGVSARLGSGPIAVHAWGGRALVLTGDAGWTALDASGAVQWATTPACTGTDVVIADTVAVCRAGQQVVAVDLATGAQAWAWTAPGDADLAIGAAGDRVVVGLNDQHLVVLDALTGALVHKLETEGAWLRTAALAGDVALAVLVQYPSAQGPGRLMAVSLAEFPKEAALAPVWEVPWESPLGDVDVSAGMVIGVETPDLVVARSLADGRLAWQQPRFAMPWAQPLDGWIAVAGTRVDGTIYLAGMDPNTGLFTWERPWSASAPPVSRSDSGDHALFWDASRWLVVRNTDGTVLGEGELSAPLDCAAATTGAAVLVEPGRSLALVPLAPRPSAELPAPSKAPPWLKAGTKLEYTLYTHGGRDSTSGRLVGLKPEPLTVEITGATDGLTFTWTRGTKTGTRTLAADVVASATSLGDDFSKSKADEKPKATSLMVSRSVLAELLADGHTSFSDAAAPGANRLELAGISAHQVRFGDGTGEGRDIPVVVAKLPGVRYDVARYGDWPLLVQAERRDTLLVLDRVIAAP